MTPQSGTDNTAWRAMVTTGKVSVGDEKDTAFPADTQARIEAELTELRQRRDRMAAEFEGDRDTVGDHADAADAIQRADEVAVIDDRIAELTRVLAGGESTSETPGALPDGTNLTLRFSDTPDAIRMRVVLIQEETPAGEEANTLTADSPLALALVGHRPGDTVTYMTPDGQQQVELLAIKYPS
jgi:transcription elongation factor GreA